MDDLGFYVRHFAFGSLLIGLCLAWSYIVNKAREP